MERLEGPVPGGLSEKGRDGTVGLTRTVAHGGRLREEDPVILKAPPLGAPLLEAQLGVKDEKGPLPGVLPEGQDV